MKIIVYPIGGAGNMVSEVIDNKKFNYDGLHFIPQPKNAFLVRQSIHASMSDRDRDFQIDFMKKSGCTALPSHLIDYHLNRQHDVILITATTPEEIDWCITRVQMAWPNIHGIKTKEEIIPMITTLVASGINTFQQTISVSDIWLGNLLEKLRLYVDTPLNEEVYTNWLQHPLNQRH